MIALMRAKWVLMVSAVGIVLMLVMSWIQPVNAGRCPVDNALFLTAECETPTSVLAAG